MRRKRQLLLLAMAMLALSLSAFATDYVISVTPDDTTNGDLDLIMATMNSASIGTPVSQSLRRVVNGAGGEIDILVHQRIDATGNLTLDDGSTVALQPTDVIHARFVVKPGAEVSLGNCTFDNNLGKERCKISQVAVMDSGGTIKKILTFPPQKIGGTN